ncbi:MAG: serine hydrolase [Oscillospiraceae bacterium]
MEKTQKIGQTVNEYAGQMTGLLGVGYEDLASGASFYYHGDTIFPTASVFKLFILAELYRQVQAGQLSLEDRYPLEARFKSVGSGVVAGLRDGAVLSVYDYALLMMCISDNTCADFLYDLTGPENIRRNVLEGIGLSHSKADLSCAQLFQYYCGVQPEQSPAEKTYAYYHGDFYKAPAYTCVMEKDDVSAPEDIVKFLRCVYCGEWCGRGVSDGMLGIMKKCQTNSRIPRLLPIDTAVAHKTGTFDRVSNDAGIVYTEKGDYILTLFYNGNLASENEYYGKNQRGAFGDDMLARLSREIYDIHTS